MPKTSTPKVTVSLGKVPRVVDRRPWAANWLAVALAGTTAEIALPASAEVRLIRDEVNPYGLYR